MNFNDDEIVGLLNRLLEMLHQADGNNQGSIVFNVYSSGSLHVDHVDTQNFYGDACTKTKTHSGPFPSETRLPVAFPCVGREKGDIDTPTLPAALCTDKAMVLWQKAQDAGYVDANYQPLISRTQAALLANYMADKLGVKEKWKVFEGLWNRKYMRSDYNLALTRKGSLDFQDELKRLFG